MEASASAEPSIRVLRKEFFVDVHSGVHARVYFGPRWGIMAAEEDEWFSRAHGDVCNVLAWAERSCEGE